MGGVKRYVIWSLPDRRGDVDTLDESSGDGEETVDMAVSRRH